MLNPFYGTVIMFGGTFPPLDWAFCSGQLIPISQNQALFSLLGDQFGGDARVTMGLPDFRGRSPVGSSTMGHGPGLVTYFTGTRLGFQDRQLGQLNLPIHTHSASAMASGGGVSGSLKVWSGGASDPNPTVGGRLAGGQATAFAATSGFSVTEVEQSGAEVARAPISVGVTNETAGSNSAFEIQNPLSSVPFIIALEGYYPSRN